MSNIRGLYDDKKDDSSDDEKDSNNRYVGGIGAQGGGRSVLSCPVLSDFGGIGCSHLGMQFFHLHPGVESNRIESMPGSNLISMLRQHAHSLSFVSIF